MKQLTKAEWIAIAVAFAVVIVFFVTGGIQLPFGGATAERSMAEDNDTQEVAKATSTTPIAPVPSGSANVEDRGGVTVEDKVKGTGATAKNGSIVSVHYTGMLQNGTVFDSSISRGQPIQFELGSGRVIEGWEKGLLDMKVGGKRRLIISPSAGYGAQGVTNPATGEVLIPANATLIFDVELVGVQ
jgi:peptidylprolyl isomerase